MNYKLIKDDLTFIPDQLISLQDAFAVLNEVTWNTQQLAQYRKEEEDLGAKQRIEQGAKAEGLEQGAQQAKEISAMNALELGLTIEQASAISGLSVDQVKKLSSHR